MSRARRSTRLSGARTRYTVDPLASEESDSIVESAEALQNKGKQAAAVDESSDEEFQAAPEEDDEEYEENGDDDDDDVDVAPENEGGEDEEGLSDDDRDEIGSGRRQKRLPSGQPRYSKKRQADGTLVLTGDETHSRGTWNPLEHVAKSIHLQVTFGLDERDLLAVLYARDRWFRGLDSGFPTYGSLDEAQTTPDYTYGSTFGIDPEEVKKESTRGWDWYYGHASGERFDQRQQIELIKESAARQTYFPAPQDGKHNVLVGPAGNQRAFSLAQREFLNFGEAWSEAKSRKKDQAGTDESVTADTPGPMKKKRQGWIIKVGNRLQCAAWAPNQNGLNQYLAIVSPISSEQREAYPEPLKGLAAPAFTSSAPYPCALQIWAFKAEKSESLTKTIDMNFDPKLRSAFCTDWGDLRRMAWCPMPREPRDEDDEDVFKKVGLLAGIWGDGYVRVLDVKVSRDPKKTEFYKVLSPAFEAKPPSTICTCVTWLSPSDIAVGCANGFVAVWSIAAAPIQADTQTLPSNAIPYSYYPIHSTYILNIASSYPTYPHLVATTSMDGETRLSSVVDHEKDMVDTNRMRVGSSHLSYSPWLQSFISSDENDFVRLLTARRFFTTTAVARLPSTVSALAPCSAWHPTALLGCTGGAVIATNPLRRLLHSKEKQWQQTWFSHTWVQGDKPNSPGTSQFYDGYRAESISLLRNTLGDRKMINGTMVITIFEEGTHVTTLAWNPNQSCAGWACAGLGCGLIRVEDVAI